MDRNTSNMDNFFCHENQACPQVLLDVGSFWLGTESDLLTSFEEIPDAYLRKQTTTSTDLDGAAIEQMLKPAVCKNFRDYAQEILIPYMSTRFQFSSRLGRMSDTYFSNSLRPTSRAKHVDAEAAIPRNWQNFLQVDTNKTQVCQKLSIGEVNDASNVIMISK
jgi:hypothetical protein